MGRSEVKDSPARSSARPPGVRAGETEPQSIEPSEGFPPLERGDARLLVLGSLPGQRSIAEQQYYAHPQNSFWPIMKQLLGIRGCYEERCAQLKTHRIAVWDVLERSVRPGSMDADISLRGARVNDFATFFSTHPDLRTIAFNGRKAEQLFARLVDPDIVHEAVYRARLPSTSPAYAAMSFADKLGAWRAAIDRTL